MIVDFDSSDTNWGGMSGRLEVTLLLVYSRMIRKELLSVV